MTKEEYREEKINALKSKNRQLSDIVMIINELVIKIGELEETIKFKQ
jgi:uncharacterized protein YdcH (DUF465 family)